MTLLRLRVRYALRLFIALQGTVATHKARFGGLSDVKVLLQYSSGMCLLKLSNWMARGKLVAQSKRATY